MRKKVLPILLILCAFIMSASIISGQANNLSHLNTQIVGCTYSIDPLEAHFLASGGPGSFDITTSRLRCNWVASSNAEWLQIINPSGTGNKQISYQVASNTSTEPRSAKITVEGLTYTVTQDGAASPPPPQGCLSLDPTTKTVDSGLATYSVTVNATCPWTARTVTPWIHIISPAPGEEGSGAVVYTVDTNTTTFDRSGSIEVEVVNLPSSNNRTHSVIQRRAGNCTMYTLSPSSAVFLPSGGTGSFDITAGLPTCRYVVYSDGAAVITSGSTGMGFGRVTYTVPQNTKNAPRTVRIIVEGTNIAHTITQFGVGCTLASPLFFEYRENGGAGIINITASLECAWEATTNSDWITITSGSGSGSGTVEFTVAPNAVSSPRSGSIIIGGQAIQITQRAFPSGQ
ncbi:MAG: BACON domain-containing protein [Acidobacteria bacterium]|nr:BACON domain-containing protein [Acidobacteriota bacterium]